MASRARKDSLAEIRQRYQDGHIAVSAQVVSKLRKDPRPGAQKLYASLSSRF